MSRCSYFSACSSKLFWLKETVMHPNINRAWKACICVDAEDRETLQRRIAAKLNSVLSHAASTVPAYESLKGRMVSLADFPVIEKKDVRGKEECFVSALANRRRIRWTHTSGSTGEPFRFGRSEFDYTYATLWRGLLRFGIRPGDKRVLVKGVDETPCVSWKTKVRRMIYGWINRCIVVDAHFLAKSEANILGELKRIKAYHPRYLHGYASSIYLLARTAEDNGIGLAELGVKAIVTESEKCHQFQRDLMERVFKAPVVENYGCVEFGMIAQPAKDGSLCVNEDHVLVETDNEGNAIITNLDEYAFPLIRFKNGDRLKLGQRHSELPYRTIIELDGRSAETIHLPQGGSLQGYIVMYPISKHMTVLKAYQVYQPDVGHLKIRLQPTAETVPQAVQDQIVSEMREIVGRGMAIGIEIVSAIPLTKRGKRAFVVSDVRKQGGCL